MTRVVRPALLIGLALAGLREDALAQSLPVCHAIRRGETATQAAQRVTGDGRNAYQPWFQIMNLSSRFVPKSQYNRVRAGWRACIVKPPIRSLSANTKHLDDSRSRAADVSAAPDGGPVSAAAPAPTARAAGTAGDRADVGSLARASDGFGRLAPVNFTVMWVCAAMVVPWFGWRIVDDYLARRMTAAIIVRYFADRFVDEFERPLVRYAPGERPVQSRLRYGARPGRFDLLLAPGEGRRYPNLADHKKNVEYDVARVMSVLADESFVSGAPYAHAGWIVVPFRFTAEPRQSGGACISSL